MRRQVWCMFLVGFAVVLSGGQAKGDITLAFEPSAQTVGLGDSVDVAVTIAGLVDFDAPSLGGFDFDLSFDDAILSFDSVAFGDPVLGDQLDLFGLGSFTDATVGPGMVNLYELSIDLPEDLDALQADSFTLTTLSFDAIGLGTSDLLISIELPNALSDAWGDPLSATTQAAQVSVVPVPPAALLGAIGLGIVGWVSRRTLV